MRSRANARFTSCPACGADAERYLFHERGARFVQCRSCDVVYVNPPAREVRDYFDIPSAAATRRSRIASTCARSSTTCCATRPKCIAPTAVGRRARVLIAGRMADELSGASSAASRRGPAHARADAPARTRGRRLTDRRAHRRRRRDGRAQPAARGVPACLGRGRRAGGATCRVGPCSSSSTAMPPRSRDASCGTTGGASFTGRRSTSTPRTCAACSNGPVCASSRNRA